MSNALMEYNSAMSFQFSLISINFSMIPGSSAESYFFDALDEF